MSLPQLNQSETDKQLRLFHPSETIPIGFYVVERGTVAQALVLRYCGLARARFFEADCPSSHCQTSGDA